MREKLLEKANKLPMLPGVYIMLDATGQVIYVGKAKSSKPCNELFSRLASAKGRGDGAEGKRL